jgi:BASS family bile acid:Na+ symporter
MDWRPLARHPVLFFTTGIVCAFIFPSWAEGLRDYIYTPLIIIMYLSTTEFGMKELRELKSYAKHVFASVFLNYVCLSAVIISSSWLLLGDHPDLYNGFVVMAAMPVAVAVVPLTRLMGGALKVSLVASCLIYVLALAVAPVMVLLFAGGNVDIWKIVEALVMLIILPLFASRLLRYLDIDRKMGIAKDIVINMNFFFIIFIVVGLNVAAFSMDMAVLSLVLLVCLLRTFISGVIWALICRMLKLSRENGVPMILFGSFKNLGLTAVIALVLFGDSAAVPAAVCFAFEFMSYVGLHPIAKYGLKGESEE